MIDRLRPGTRRVGSDDGRLADSRTGRSAATAPELDLGGCGCPGSTDCPREIASRMGSAVETSAGSQTAPRGPAAEALPSASRDGGRRTAEPASVSAAYRSGHPRLDLPLDQRTADALRAVSSGGDPGPPGACPRSVGGRMSGRSPTRPGAGWRRRPDREGGGRRIRRPSSPGLRWDLETDPSWKWIRERPSRTVCDPGPESCRCATPGELAGLAPERCDALADHVDRLGGSSNSLHRE